MMLAEMALQHGQATVVLQRSIVLPRPRGRLLPAETRRRRGDSIEVAMSLVRMIVGMT
jgi:hypothetical protein